MTREEQLKYCSVCKNKDFSPAVGIICGKTNEMATFTITCPDYLEDEKEIRIEEKAKQSEKKEISKEINRGRYALFIIGGLYILLGFYEAYLSLGHQLIFGIIDWSFSAIFLGLGIWSYKKASLAMILGLGFYILLIVLLAVVDPYTIFKGILWKALVISSLIYGIKTAITEERKIKSQMKDLLDQF